jgi:hypothetical protein
LHTTPAKKRDAQTDKMTWIASTGAKALNQDRCPRFQYNPNDLESPASSSAYVQLGFTQSLIVRVDPSPELPLGLLESSAGPDRPGYSC